MGHRWCDDCERWHSTAEYTVDETGQTVCREDGHGSVSGFVIDGEVSHLPNGSEAVAKKKAREQRII